MLWTVTILEAKYSVCGKPFEENCSEFGE